MTKEELKDYLHEYWIKNKENPEFKSKRKAMHKKYYIENREKELEYKAKKRKQNENMVAYAQ